MIKMLCPDIYLDSIYQLNLSRLKEKGIKGIITDLDNTLVAWDQDEIYPQLEEWVKILKNEGFKVCIVSNNSFGRVKEFAEVFDVPAIPEAVKPRRKSFRLALEKMQLQAEETAVLGDQVFTDVLGGNRLGLFTILVTPVSKQEFIGTRIVRQVEKLVLKKLKKKGMLSR